MHSYLSASCPLPPRFSSGLLSLARATFSIENSPDLNVEAVRTLPRALSPAYAEKGDVDWASHGGEPG